MERFQSRAECGDIHVIEDTRNGCEFMFRVTGIKVAQIILDALNEEHNKGNFVR